jgi:hypothetical protein
MTKKKKALQKWKESIQPQTPRQDVETMGRRYGFRIEYLPGSHMRFFHDALKGKEGYTDLGFVEIPSVGGQKVKKEYIKDLLKAIDLIENEEGKDEKE